MRDIKCCTLRQREKERQSTVKFKVVRGPGYEMGDIARVEIVLVPLITRGMGTAMKRWLKYLLEREERKLRKGDPIGDSL